MIERPANELIRYLEVPPVPGAYRLEAWLEDGAGKEIRRVGTDLRFDDVAPPAPAPQAPLGWIPGDEPALLKVGHPAGPLPLSGIRGYAISLDRGSGGSPLRRPVALLRRRKPTSPAESATTALSLGTLPEGTTYARVVAVSGAGVPSPGPDRHLPGRRDAAERLADGDPRRLEQRPGQDHRPRAGTRCRAWRRRARPVRSPGISVDEALRLWRQATRRRPG